MNLSLTGRKNNVVPNTVIFDENTSQWRVLSDGVIQAGTFGSLDAAIESLVDSTKSDEVLEAIPIPDRFSNRPLQATI